MNRHRTLVASIPAKHTLRAVIGPAEHAAYVRTLHPAATLATTAGTVLVHQRSALNRILGQLPFQELDRWASATLHLIRHRDLPITLCSAFGPGSPATALVVEQLNALGTPAVISIGTAAALRPDLAPGDLVVCDRALRGEGTSPHYLPPGDFAHPDIRLTAALACAATDHGHPVRRGATWTTDALYRESGAEARLYARRGIWTADMEAAALFAVGRHRRLPVAAAFAVADSLVNRTPRTDHPSTADALEQLLSAALDTLATCAGPASSAARTRVGPDHEHEREEQRG